MVTKKKTLKKAPTKRKSTAKKKTVEMRSFKVARPTKPFFTLNFSEQSVYWLVIGIMALVFTVWIMMLQAKIYDLYDSIDMSENSSINVPLESPKKDK